MTEPTRCWWCGSDPLYVRYHDEEWGRRVDDDRRLYEKICLEGFQAGLSWITILRKRERFRTVFHAFDFERVARMTRRDVDRLMGDAGIVRHRGKIESAINNAKRARELRERYGSLAKFVYRFQPPAGARPRRLTRDAVVALTQTPESVALSRELKAAGWTFVGPTTMYAFMQSVGVVNDHVEGCAFRTLPPLAT